MTLCQTCTADYQMVNYYVRDRKYLMGPIIQYLEVKNLVKWSVFYNACNHFCLLIPEWHIVFRQMTWVKYDLRIEWIFPLNERACKLDFRRMWRKVNTTGNTWSWEGSHTCCVLLVQWCYHIICELTTGQLECVKWHMLHEHGVISILCNIKTCLKVTCCQNRGSCQENHWNN